MPYINPKDELETRVKNLIYESEKYKTVADTYVTFVTANYASMSSTERASILTMAKDNNTSSALLYDQYIEALTKWVNYKDKPNKPDMVDNP